MGNASKETMVVELYKARWNRSDLTLREILLKLYVEDGLTQNQIKREMHVGLGTVSEWLKKENIPARKMKWTF